MARNGARVQLTKTLTAHMSQAHLEQGDHECATCPVALAITARGFEVAVSRTTASLAIRDVAFAQYKLTRAVRDWITDYDMARAMAPIGTFRLTRISEPMEY